jgi:flavodoxin
MAGKYLIVYYSRMGVSEQLAQALSKKLNCDVDNVYYADRDKDSFAAVGKMPDTSQQFLSKEIKQGEFNLDQFAK